MSVAEKGRKIRDIRVPAKKKEEKKEKVDKVIKDGIKCPMCGELKAPNNYYVSNSPVHESIKKVPYCKICVTSMVNVYNEHSVRRVLMLIDKPFIHDLYYDVAKKEHEKTNRDWFSVYLKNLAIGKWRLMTWEDSDREVEQNGRNQSTDEFWGSGYSPADIEFLEDYYRQYEYTFATDNPVQINIYKSIAVTNLQSRKALQEGKMKEYRDLMKLSSELHKDAHINPSQITGANDDKGVSTYGLWIKMIEQEEPCEYFEDKKAYEDYDSFQKYIEKWFVRPMKNLFGLGRDFDVDMEEEIEVEADEDALSEEAISIDERKSDE